MNYDWTLDGYRFAQAQDVTAEEVHFVLTLAKPVIKQPDGGELKYTGRTRSGRLIDVWLTEDVAEDDHWWVIGAHEAGLASEILFRRLVRDEE